MFCNLFQTKEKEKVQVPAGPPPHVIAMDLATGHWKAQATRAFITSNIANVMEKLCSKDNNFVSVQDIANETNLHPNATYRLLRFLSTFDVCIENEDLTSKRFKLGPVGAVLTPNHPQSVAKHVIWEASSTTTSVWNKLEDFLKTDKMVVQEATGGPDLWAHFAQNPAELEIFQEAMTGVTNEEAFFLFNKDLSPTFDLSSYSTICDLGGAEGTLSLMLTKRFPDCKYIISDLPECVARIDSSNLPSNFSIEAADFLKTAPVADAYLLKHIIHDWDNKHSIIILNNIKKANSDAAIFVLEFGPMPGPNVPHLSKGFDLHMGVMLNSLERTQEEYDALYEQAGYERIGLHRLAGGAHPLYVQEIKAKK